MSRRARSTLALVLTLAALIFGGVWQAGAQMGQLQSGATAAQQTPPTTAGLLDHLLGGLFPTTTTTRPPPEGTFVPDPPPPGAAPGGGASPPTTAAGSPTTERTIPPEAQAIINSVLRTGSNNTVALLEALRGLRDVGMTEEEAALVGMGQFPVAGEAWWSDDWYEARFTPEFHFHEGTDIFAARGTPVRAPADGLFEDASGGAGGLAANITIADGTYYYMAHLDGFPRDLRSGSRVKQGQVVGFVGDSGNAVGGSPHLHFEVHPRGGGPVNPKPILDRWIIEAIANVPKILAPYKQVSLSRAVTAAGMLRRLDTGSLGPPVSSDGPQLWATSVRRENGGIRMAGIQSDQSPWDPRVRGAAARANDWKRADQLARNVLAPLTPPVLNGVLQHGH